MRLVIEREGGFLVLETDEVCSIEVLSRGVKLELRDGSSDTVDRKDHAAACQLSAAIAVKCGVLVEPLAEGPEVVTEAVMSDPNEVLVPPRNPRWDGRRASEWVDGEPPKDGRWYVAQRSGEGCPRVVQWRREMCNGAAYYDADDEDRYGFESAAHLPTPIPNR